MKVTEHIKNANGKTLFSFELLPPLKGATIEKIYDTIDSLLEFEPSFIDVTSHREEYVYKDKGNGLLQKVTTRKRPGTVGITAAIQNKYKIDTVPHIICGGFTKEETEYALIDLHFLGIDNILALRGDPIKTEKSFVPTKNGNNYAIDLLEQTVALNNGQYLHDEIQNSNATDFCVGVAAYPEKHFESPNLKSDIHFLKKKVEMGAEYVVTQLFYDNKKYFDFVEKCRDAGITVPIIPGIKPIATKKHLNIIPQYFHVDLPEDLVDATVKAKNNKEIRQIGVEWSIQQCKELIAAGVPSLHFYTMGNSSNIVQIANEVF